MGIREDDIANRDLLRKNVHQFEGFEKKDRTTSVDKKAYEKGIGVQPYIGCTIVHPPI